MGTTLTGTTPQDTYDSLIKVTDNGPLTGSLKKLTDGLGNDSSLSLSTAAASLSGTLAVTGAATLSSTLAVSGDTTLSGASGNRTLQIQSNTSGSPVLALTAAGDDGAAITYNRGLNYLSIGVSSASTAMVINTSGNVGIGTTAPSGKLHVAGGDIFLGASYALKYSSTSFITPENNVSGAEISTAGSLVVKTGATPAERIRVTDNGLTFNGDTAAANALDDYEEGTWTGTLRGSVSDPTTAVTATGRYTKIGRMVTAEIQLDGVNTTGASGGVSVTGLPFASLTEAQGATMCDLFVFGTLCTSVNCYVSPFGTTMNFFTSGSGVAWAQLAHSAGAGRSLRGTLTYFV